MSTPNRTPGDSKYSTGNALATLPVAMSAHALQQYERRTPPGAVAPAVAWRRGEDIEHPAVVRTYNETTPPDRVRIYNHNCEYWVVFLCAREPTDPANDYVVMTVYNLHTHEHGPTQSYLGSHGPHYEPDEGER